jgi:hypothetical protein
MKTIRVIHLVLLALLAPVLAVNPPGILNHQGRIAVNGLNYDGTGHFKFALVTSDGATTLWSNDGTGSSGSEPAAAVAVPIDKGHYAVMLGDTTLANMTQAIPPVVFTDNETVALRLWFATADEGPFELLTPDRRIAATGYALAAQRAEAVAPGGVTSTMLADGAVTAGKIARGAVTGIAFAPGAVTSAAVADGSINSRDLALGATGLVRKPVLLAEVGGGSAMLGPGEERDDSLGNGWLIETVDSAGDVGRQCSLIFSPTGDPIIAYLDATNNDVVLLRHDGTAWVRSLIDSQSDLRTHTSISLALTPQGTPAVTYFDFSGGMRLKYASYDGSNWNITTLVAGDRGEYNSLAIKQTGERGVAWYNHSRNGYDHFNLWYSRWNEQTGTWIEEVVDPPDDSRGYATGVGISLAFDPASGCPAISYGCVNFHKLKFASFNGTTWDLVELSTNDVSYPDTSLAFDSEGNPAFSYFQDTPGLYYAHRDGATWALNPVDTTANVGKSSSLSFGAGGRPVISYYDESNGDLKLARYNGGSWESAVVDSEGDVGLRTSLRIKASGRVGIAYYDVTNGNLKYAEGGTLEWQGDAASVFAAGGKAYHTTAGSGEGEFKIFDISDRAQPSSLVELASPHPTFALAGARDVFVTGSTAYLTAGNDSALNIMDVSNPASPQLLALLRDGVGGFNRLAGAWSVFVSGNTAYVTAACDDALTIIDVSNPSEPVKLAEIVDEVGGFTNLAGARDVYVVGTTAYVTAATDHALTILDVSNPAAPVLLTEIVDESGGFTKLAGAREVFVLDGVAYVTADEDDALTIIDVGNPSSPILLSEMVDGVGGFNRLDGAAGVHVSGSIAMVTAEGDDAVSMIDVSNPAVPVLLEEIVDESGGFTQLDGADGIFIYGTIALVASNQDNALILMDLASPEAEYAGTVTNAALATDSVTSDKILDGSVGNADVGANAIDSSKIADASIEGDDLADDTIDSNKIVDSSIGNEDLADGVVDSGKIADKSITEDDFADNAVTTSALADDSVTTDKILDETILSEDLADGAVTGDKIADGGVGASKLAAGGVATDALASGAVTAEKIASGSVTLDKLGLGGSTGQILYNTGTATEWRNPAAVLGDESATNEIQVLSRDGDDLTLTPGGGSVPLGDGDSNPANELQDLVLTGGVLSISSGSPASAIVDLSSYFQRSPTGELDLAGSAIQNVSQILAAGTPATLGITGTLNLGGNGIENVASLRSTAGGSNPLQVSSDLNMDGNRIFNLDGLGIGVGGGSLGSALQVESSDAGPDISLFRHTLMGGSGNMHSAARFVAQTSGDMGDGFGSAVSFEIADGTAGPNTIARVGAVREDYDLRGVLQFQTGNETTGLLTRMKLDSYGCLWLSHDLRLGTAETGDNDTIYFDNGDDEYLEWQDGQDRFRFSNDVVATSFNPASDRSLKENFGEIDPIEVLDQVMAMPVTSWNFKEDDPALRHIGPTSQDFHRIFGYGSDKRHISTTDADGVAFAAIQGLKRLLDDKERKIRELERRLERLERSNRGNRSHDQ